MGGVGGYVWAIITQELSHCGSYFTTQLHPVEFGQVRSTSGSRSLHILMMSDNCLLIGHYNLGVGRGFSRAHLPFVRQKLDPSPGFNRQGGGTPRRVSGKY